MRMLDIVSGWELSPLDVGLHEARNSGRVFSYWEQGALLDGLGRSRKPLVSGLKEGALHDGIAR